MPAVVFVLLGDDDGQVLMEQRPPDDRHFPGGLVFPGGKIEEGESETVALLREIQEELGLRLCSFRPLHPPVPLYWGIEGNPKYQVFPYLVTDWGGPLPPATLDSACPLVWQTLEQARQAKARLAATIAGLVTDWVAKQAAYERRRAANS